MILYSVMHPANAVTKACFPMAVRIDNVFYAVLLRHLCKDALFFQNICGRIMKEQNIFHKTVTSRSFKGNSQPLGLPLYKLLRFFLIIFVPADDLTSRIDEKWSLKSRDAYT